MFRPKPATNFRRAGPARFIPHILCILRVVGGGGCSLVRQSDRGDTNFEQTSEDNIRRMGSDGGLLIDSHGLTPLTSVPQLEPHSRKSFASTCEDAGPPDGLGPAKIRRLAAKELSQEG